MVESFLMNDEMQNPNLAAIIKEFREKRALTQEHLAQLAEVNIRTIQRLEASGSCSKDTLRAVAEAFDVDVRDLLALAENKTTQSENTDQEVDEFLKKHVISELKEVLGPKDLINSMSGCHAHMNDFPDNITDQQSELIGMVLDYLSDYADLEADIYPSQRIQMMQDVKALLDKLKKTGVTAFTGQFKQSFVSAGQEKKPFSWSISVINLVKSDSPKILKSQDGRRYIVVMIPKERLRIG